MAHIKFEIKETLGVVSELAKGWNKELNLMSWHGREFKYDIRNWDSEHKKMEKGVTLNVNELRTLKEILNKMRFREAVILEQGFYAYGG
ncbi:YdbC family protein [Clostridium sporogenes]|uniref:YdbC family protein n=1 Tax=Clostridium sporogenes TaxID=1509 RepID=UPI00062BFC70|nr:PC4/YdbC family ssDNA-binding protein [Clostridium sporogenes]NFR24829.1 hypothetical protein [Clostridium sporogenes]